MSLRNEFCSDKRPHRENFSSVNRKIKLKKFIVIENFLLEHSDFENVFTNLTQYSLLEKYFEIESASFFLQITALVPMDSKQKCNKVFFNRSQKFS